MLEWFDDVFYPEVRKKTGCPVLLLLDNAPGQVSALKRIAFFLLDCTSWKHPCDVGIIAAPKKV